MTINTRDTTGYPDDLAPWEAAILLGTPEPRYRRRRSRREVALRRIKDALGVWGYEDGLRSSLIRVTRRSRLSPRT